MITILINNLFLGVLLVAVSACQLLAPSAPPKLEPEIKEVNNLNDLLTKFDFGKDEVSFQFKELKGETIASLNEKEERIPASLNKVFTFFFTLSQLPLNYRFKTFLKYRGNFSRSRYVLQGDLCLVGQGDPDLEYDDLFDLALRLKEYGVRKVEGNLYFDDSYFERHKNIFDFPETSESYNQSFSGLNLERNRFHYVWDFSTENKELSFFASPSVVSSPLMGTVEELEDFSFGDGGWVYDRSSGAFRGRGQERLPLKESGEAAGQIWQKILKDVGIDFSLENISRKHCPYKNDFRVLFSHEGRELEDLLHESFLNSDNLVLELLSMHAAKKRNKAIRTRDEALENMRSYLSKRYGISLEDLKIDRASGLTDKSRIAPWVFVKVLEKSFRSYGKRHVLSFFPLLGFKGTLRKRLKSPFTDLRIWAKTGTVNYASNLAGYIVYQGRTFAFSIMLNNLSKRFALQAEKEKGKKKFLDDQASLWIQRARDFQDELVLLFTKSLDSDPSNHISLKFNGI